MLHALGMREDGSQETFRDARIFGGTQAGYERLESTFEYIRKTSKEEVDA